MATFFKGTEIKFAIELTAEGFSMDDNNFDIQVATAGSSISGSKTGTATTGQGSQEVSIFKDGDTWYAVADTSSLKKGDLRVIATAHIPDNSVNDNMRNEIAVATLGNLQNP